MKAPSIFRLPITRLNDWLKRVIARRLNREVTGYDIKVLNNMERLYKHIRKGDVVLVEGMLRISQLIKYTTQSPWSHCALYVIRVCRPFKIDPADLARVIDSAIADLGKAYDNRNFLELTLLLLCPVKIGPLKNWTIQTCLGNCTEHQVICSGMIAQAFQRMGYPILPVVDVGDPPDEKLLEALPYGYPLTMRHYSQILPRDFDLSPNFQVIKFNIIEDGQFDYKRLAWKTISGANSTSLRVAPSR